MTQKFKYIMLAGLMATSVSCKKALDINTDPYSPTTAPINKLLPKAEENLGIALTTGASAGGISQVLEVYTHRLVVREDPDQYGATGDDFDIGTNWSGLYVSTIPNLDAIITQGTKDNNMHYVGIAEILKAYAYSQLVDVYGDVPYTQADKLGNLSPKFDKGADIYASITTLLDKGITDVNTAVNSSTNPTLNLLDPGADDVIYGGVADAGSRRGGDISTPGSVSKWELAANSIKLKLLVQQRLKTDVTAQVNALVAGGKLIGATAESFLVPFGPNGAYDDRNPGFGDYFASQRGNYISPWFYEILKGVNPAIFFGNPDPRRPYYYFKQETAATVPGHPIEYRDANGFLSIYFGSQGPNAAQIQQDDMTVVGIYPVGGRYDDGKGGSVTATSGTGAAPYRMITYADVLFLEAEMQEVAAPNSATTTLKAAITEAFKQVDYVITTYVKPTQTVPTLSTLAASTTYINNVMAEYASPTSAPGYDVVGGDKRLQIIMTQKWISSFGSAVDAYTDYRRTGYPVLFDPKNTTMAPGGKVQPPANGNTVSKPENNNPEVAVPVTVGKNYPQTLPWASAEITRNANAPAQKSDPSTYLPFWK
ncbi:SusD/RagB family nutrient-binding outer membrane lipoprotein [Mucilaginibacter sp. dw_454]|uniref:SusD/RagB family nutrient-binding outer membrane lipoprotein n=1 Tax=Mucilaginibacter sp. dw_454 TaxID=2720079 RepID=UPI001BD38EC5|nr:SusD/RagB family nutrient-binding outer membrane lipoprotein [Mucilaginibacter sp. dw_454]